MNNGASVEVKSNLQYIQSQAIVSINIFGIIMNQKVHMNIYPNMTIFLSRYTQSDFLITGIGILKTRVKKQLNIKIFGMDLIQSTFVNY